MVSDTTSIFVCNSASTNLKKNSYIELNYLKTNRILPNVYLGLPKFVCSVNFLPNRILDLLEIASYLFAADRLVKRGNIDSVEYHSWSRLFKFIIKIRDFDFWSEPEVIKSLNNVLTFITGDKSYSFDFQPGHSTFPTSLFDREECRLIPTSDQSIILFSGGLDSLAGVVERLNATNDKINLVSHQTQPSTKRTQKKLFEALKRKYPGRIEFFPFATNLHKIRAREETQRIRSFLYMSIAFSLATALSNDRFFVFENGFTSLNFARREDLSNARASRTTHPNSIRLVESLFSKILERNFTIEIPFLWKTKADIFELFKKSGDSELIPSTVSCSRTFQKLENATHCGCCFQCVDRRIAAYASDLNEIDESGIYAIDIINDPINSGVAKTTVVDYLRQAMNFRTWNVDYFYEKMMPELSLLPDSMPECRSDLETVERIFDLCKRHAKKVEYAIKKMRIIHDNPNEKLKPDSLLFLISEREHLKEPIDRLTESIIQILSKSIPVMFRDSKPKDEPDLNIKVHALLKTHYQKLRSEHPTTSFACASVIPDHELLQSDVLIESKYIRKSTTPSKASDGIAADITKYPSQMHTLFFVYDPYYRIKDRDEFKKDFEGKGNCTICIL